jgi:hypothetical protein
VATVTGFTAARMQEIEDNTIVDADIVGSNLILTKQDASTVDAGVVVGPTGAPGVDGDDGAPGSTGPAGAIDLVGAPLNITTAHAQMLASGLISGLVRNNVSVVSGNTYGIRTDFMLEWASVDVDARWDIWCRVNGVNFDRFAVVLPGVVGNSLQPVRSEVLWVAPTTQATDDFTVYAELHTPGAPIIPSGSATLKRKLWIIDYGTP